MNQTLNRDSLALKRSSVCHVERSETSLAIDLRRSELQRNDQRFFAFPQSDKAGIRRFNVSTVQLCNVREFIDFAHVAR